jgi:hypothetical protein
MYLAVLAAVLARLQIAGFAAVLAGALLLDVFGGIAPSGRMPAGPLFAFLGHVALLMQPKVRIGAA